MINDREALDKIGGAGIDGNDDDGIVTVLL